MSSDYGGEHQGYRKRVKILLFWFKYNLHDRLIVYLEKGNTFISVNLFFPTIEMTLLMGKTFSLCMSLFCNKTQNCLRANETVFDIRALFRHFTRE